MPVSDVPACLISPFSSSFPSCVLFLHLIAQEDASTNQEVHKEGDNEITIEGGLGGLVGY